MKKTIQFVVLLWLFSCSTAFGENVKPGLNDLSVEKQSALKNLFSYIKSKDSAMSKALLKTGKFGLIGSAISLSVVFLSVCLSKSSHKKSYNHNHHQSEDSPLALFGAIAGLTGFIGGLITHNICNCAIDWKKDKPQSLMKSCKLSGKEISLAFPHTAHIVYALTFKNNTRIRFDGYDELRELLQKDADLFLD